MLSVLRNSVLGLLVLALAPSLSALAQTEDVATEGVRIFEPGYYAEFDPVTALDMVNRTPGFNPEEQDGGRGLSGVRSNILIDGERPPPKGQSSRQRLNEMPIYGVDRIELIDAGARLDIDMQGFPQVLNVVTVANPPAYYDVVSELRRAGTGDARQNNEREAAVAATGSFSWRVHEFTLRGDVRDRSNQSPADFVSIDPANPEQRIASLNRSDQKNSGIELGADLSLPDDGSLKLTSRFTSWQASSAPITLDESGADLGAVSQTFDNENDQQRIAAEYRGLLGLDGTFLLALVDASSTNQSESSLTDDGLSRSSVTNRETGESAARILVTQTLSERLTLRITATTAFNFFEGGFRLFESGVELPVAGSDSRVEEDRHSLAASADWNLSDRWTLRGGLGAEAYEIDSRDVSSGLQKDPKGEFSLSFRPRERTTLSLESRREIGQLSFGEFLASSSLSSEILTAGAGTLEPERSWTHAATYDRRFGDVGVMRFVLSRERVDNPVRSVALSDSLIVAQNTSARTIDRAQASIEFPFERFGLDDLVLRAEGMVAQSDTIDPVTGETREVSGLRTRYWSLGLRRDPGGGSLAWGMSMSRATDGDDYAVRRIGEADFSAEWRAYVEWEPIDGLKLRANVDGPRWTTRRSNFFASVRRPGLDPSFVSSTTTRVDRTASISLEWRRRERFQIRASFSARPKTRTEESLATFGESNGSFLATEFARTPRATLRFRVFR
jgi:hypothetical protein